MEAFILEKHNSKTNNWTRRLINVIDRLSEFITKFYRASKETEHYYISSVITANNENYDYAAGNMHKKSNQFRTNKYKNPKTLPLIPPRTLSHPNRLPDACSHPSCRNEKRRTSLPNNGLTRHGLYCDGSKPQWEAFIVLNLLTPSILMNDLSS